MTTTTQAIFTVKHKNTGNDPYCWAVMLSGKPMVWNCEKGESEATAAKWNKTRVRTAYEMALTPHNLDRKGNTATTPDHETWVWQTAVEMWVRIK